MMQRLYRVLMNVPIFCWISYWKSVHQSKKKIGEFCFFDVTSQVFENKRKKIAEPKERRS
jgi:hypothetical protein